jgi:D-3-phosphoglycerate dehydrogenase
MHNITRSYIQVREGKWIRDANRGTELGGKTVGIIGFGNTGQAFARVLKGFNVNILAYDKYKKGFGSDEVKEVTLNELLQHSDVVSLHLPLNTETLHYANDEFFSLMKKKPFFLCARRVSRDGEPFPQHLNPACPAEASDVGGDVSAEC